MGHYLGNTIGWKRADAVGMASGDVLRDLCVFQLLGFESLVHATRVWQKLQIIVLVFLDGRYLSVFVIGKSTEFLVSQVSVLIGIQVIEHLVQVGRRKLDLHMLDRERKVILWDFTFLFRIINYTLERYLLRLCQILWRLKLMLPISQIS